MGATRQTKQEAGFKNQNGVANRFWCWKHSEDDKAPSLLFFRAHTTGISSGSGLSKAIKYRNVLCIAPSPQILVEMCKKVESSRGHFFS